MGTCPHDMASPRFEDRGAGLEISRIASNILYKHSRKDAKAWSSSLGVDGITNHGGRTGGNLGEFVCPRVRGAGIVRC